MATFTLDAIQSMPQRFRANFINSLSGFKSANLIGTISKEGQTNLAIISSAFHIGAEPAMMGFISRPHSVDRHTLENVINVGYYTLNHVTTSIIEPAHQTSARYPKEVSEFAATGLSELWVDGYAAPFVKESSVRVGLEYKEHHTLLNNTVMVIGSILHVEVPDNSIHEDGLVDMSITETVAVSGLDTYHSPKKVTRLAYAKPNTAPEIIESSIREQID